jgi:hypothetical protein
LLDGPRLGDVRSTAMSAFENRQIELKPDQIAYLDEAVKAFGIENAGKAVRILINYARENPDKRNEIFGDIHCTGDC